MTWALIVVVVWLALATAAALAIGRGIRMADEQDAGGTAEQPDRVLDGAHDATTRRVPTKLSRRDGENLTEGSAPFPAQSSEATVPTLTRSG